MRKDASEVVVRAGVYAGWWGVSQRPLKARAGNALKLGRVREWTAQHETATSHVARFLPSHWRFSPFQAVVSSLKVLLFTATPRCKYTRQSSLFWKTVWRMISNSSLHPSADTSITIHRSTTTCGGRGLAFRKKGIALTKRSVGFSPTPLNLPKPVMAITTRAGFLVFRRRQ